VIDLGGFIIVAGSTLFPQSLFFFFNNHHFFGYFPKHMRLGKNGEAMMFGELHRRLSFFCFSPLAKLLGK